MGVLRQDQFAFDEFRVIDTVIMGNKRLWKALQERDAIYDKAEMTDEDGMRVAELEGIVADEDGYTAESDAAVLLDGLDIPEALHERKMGELQGGQKVRVLLAQALFGHPQALLLDEPTNHLDLDSIHWLEDFLNRYDGTVIVISHDRHFLNDVCTHIADIDYQTIIQYTGGYDDMVMAEDPDPLPHRVRERPAREEDRPAERLHPALRRRHPLQPGDSRGARKWSACSPATWPAATSRAPSSSSTRSGPAAATPWSSRTCAKGYDGDGAPGGHPRLHAPTSPAARRSPSWAATARQDHAAEGPAGQRARVSRQLRQASGYRDSRRGTVGWGHEANVGYFAQDFRESIPGGWTLVDWLRQFDPDAPGGDPRRAGPDALPAAKRASRRPRCSPAARPAA